MAAVMYVLRGVIARRGIHAIAIVLFLAGCAAPGPYQVNLMPAPDVFDEQSITPFTDTAPILKKGPYQGILYATDREPIDVDAQPSSQDRFYTNARGHLLRLGLASIELGEGQFTWEEARRISLAKTRSDKYPLKVTGVDEFGILDRSFSGFEAPELLKRKSSAPARRFANLINQKLAMSEQKDVFIYVHGYKVIFDNPILVATELWHYLGYEGVFIAYAWPSTPKSLAYFADAETTTASAYKLRLLLEYLAQETAAERIHIIGYSQGTRLVTQTIFNLGLKHHDDTRDEVLHELRIGNVILIGSDVDREVMATYIVDGLMKVPQQLTVYVSKRDKAMGLAELLLGRRRLGQMFEPGEMSLGAIEFLSNTPEISIIDVTEAADATVGNGHNYFRSSPWVSSDILMTLRYNLRPGDRGLVIGDKAPIWSFPPDYITRLRAAIATANPALIHRLDKQESMSKAK